MITIAADDLPTLWEEYVEEMGFVPAIVDWQGVFAAPNTTKDYYKGNKFILPEDIKIVRDLIIAWLFGGKDNKENEDK